MNRPIALIAVLLSYLVAGSCTAQETSAAPIALEKPPDFDRDVRPLLRNHCVKCHGPLRQEGKLNLGVPAGIARGGERGAVIVPGQPAESLLWQMVEQDEMPEGTPLSADEKQLLKRWIEAGAPGLPRSGEPGTNAGTEPRAPGRHWYSLSRDGGKTWTEPADWRYDDGAQFFSPATMAKILRHSRTGKLYWFGNISPGQTSGNSPRYPFYVAEIDETGPALKRATLTVLDDYDPARHTPAVQFSNFYVFENRETREFEIYLSPYGQYGNVYQASVYKYVIRLK